ncbi:CDP-6-deoxy-L-threo-D-glycero-4-hexulose-3-dehydrase reductase [Cupriavidus yeoncheonensis]|uniref:CDP-6-deoxy-L-threo-D-glycero-4-hexulose-3-dehydrase reductase n=1 Tax=Cupriavidus yeoncheonensis TaxID=1462994 RepID=A0A916IY54_9BURK|nr:CDP-6-deoxy-delta-3,4-glucoseen reductase [Cupriavidus yeoncheonensis]CAG2153711.1 CDP-6-deoxy-L-threo-D-glycero-4-hexulose-3-dehydrase reductase [Cupriavidus yeoncheonensis]
MTETVMELPTHPVTFEPVGHTLPVREGDTILAAALSHNFPLPHGCRTGTCGTCKARVLEGEVDHGDSDGCVLSAAERAQGYALLCQAKPRSALAIASSVVRENMDIPIVRLPCRVQQLERLAHDVMRIRLRLPARQRLKFLPGQYINIVMPGGIRRSLSMANSPQDEELVELHLRNYGGPFSTHVFNVLKENDLLRIEGPVGAFFVREQSAKPIIFVASGTGFAPIKAMIEHEASKGSGRPMNLYWGGRRPADLYLDALAKTWQEKYGVRYVPVVSEARAEDAWQGRTGFVHRAVMEDHPDLSGHQVYACGAPIVVQSARDDFINVCRLPETEFFADIFVSGGSKVRAAA